MASAGAKERVAVIGSGNWGSVAARICGQSALESSGTFEERVRMWVYEEQVEPASADEAARLVKRAGGDPSAAQLSSLLNLERAPKQLGEAVAGAFSREGGAKGGGEGGGEWWGGELPRLREAGVKRPLSEAVARSGENVKYLPGVLLGENVEACASLERAVEGATLLVFVTPHQFIKGVCQQLRGRGVLAEGARAVSLIKGMEVVEREPYFEMISQLIGKELGLDCSVLMGANLAQEIGLEGFSEATLGYSDAGNAAVFHRLFQRPYFNVTAVEDIEGVELCGTLKNIVALGAGFVDGLRWGNNTKAAVLRIGLQEMRLLARLMFPRVKDETFFQSAGVGDLIATCYGGRNRKCAEAFAAAGGAESWDSIEERLLNGQKLQGVLTSQEVQAVLRLNNLEHRFPLFTTINRICRRELPVAALTSRLSAPIQR